MRVKGVDGGYSGVRRTVQLKGLEVLKGLESQATVKTNYANLSCSLRYPFWFSEINLESDLLVEGSGTEELKGLEVLKGLESQAIVKLVSWLIKRNCCMNYANLSCSLRYSFWFSEINLVSDLLVEVVSVRGKSGMEILLGCVGSGNEELKGLEGQATVNTNYANPFWVSEMNLPILLGCVGSGSEVLKGLEGQATVNTNYAKPFWLR